MILRLLSSVPWSVRPALVAAVGLTLAAPATAQRIDVREIFSNDAFYKESGLLLGRGDVDFVADVWLLPGMADSTRALIGVSMSNSALKFIRAEDGWRANYTVAADLEPEDGAKLERRWDKSLDVATFDETLLTGETVVFQSEVSLPPGEYEIRLGVTDRNAEETSRAEGAFVAPRPAVTMLGEPVPLRMLERRGEQVDYVVHPSHTFPTAPERIEFMIVAEAPTATAPLVAHARLVEQEADEDDAPLATTIDTLAPAPDGSAHAFGTLASRARFGEYDLEVALLDASGKEIARSRTPLLLGGSAAWIIDHWEDALSLIKYEATEDELEILEDIEEPDARVEAWTCFWRMRDPIEATAANEAMQDYFGRIHTANEMWTSTLRPGYLSDRGRVFVTLGPPTDIQSNPMPGGPEPFEVWTYERGKQFQLLFVDRIGFNNYQLDSMTTYQRELAFLELRKRKFLDARARLCPVLQPAFAKESD